MTQRLNLYWQIIFQKTRNTFLSSIKSVRLMCIIKRIFDIILILTYVLTSITLTHECKEAHRTFCPHKNIGKAIKSFGLKHRWWWLFVSFRRNHIVLQISQGVNNFVRMYFRCTKTNILFMIYFWHPTLCFTHTKKTLA